MNTNVYDSEYKTAVWMSTCSCILSILGSFAIFGSYIFIPGIRNYSRKLVTCLTVADFLTALGICLSCYLFLISEGYLISALAYFEDTTDKVCTTQSVITTYSSLVSFYLTVFIAIHIFATVVYRQNTTSSWKFLLWANIISWFIPGIIVGVAGEDKVLGRNESLKVMDPNNATVGTGLWCWLKLDHSRYTMWMFLTGKGWEFLCYLITTSLYVLLKFYLYLRYSRRTFPDIHQSLRQDDQNYLYVWFVLYVLRLWGSLRAIMHLACKDRDICKAISKIFMYMQAVGDPGQAFCNCILFCFLDGTVRSSLFKFCCGTPHNPASPRERERLITGSQNYDVHRNEHEETVSERHFLVQSGNYSSFVTSQHDRSTQTCDGSPKNVCVQSDQITSLNH